MFHATIRSEAHQPFRFSGAVVPYDLEVLREHVLARAGRSTRVEVRVPLAARGAFVRALRGLDARGIVLVVRAVAAC
jgi:hypothetical protein